MKTMTEQLEDAYALLSDSESEGDFDELRGTDMLAFQTEHFTEKFPQRADTDEERDEMAAAALAFARQKSMPYEMDLEPEPDSDSDEQHSGLPPEGQPFAAIPSAMLSFQTEHFDEAEEEAEAISQLPPQAFMTSFHTEHFNETAPHTTSLDAEHFLTCLGSEHFNGSPSAKEPEDLGRLRGKLKGQLHGALEDGSLVVALQSSGGFGRGGSGTSTDVPPEAPEVATEEAAKAKAREATLLVLQAVSQRDRRIGELAAQVASAVQRIYDQESGLKEMEKQIGSLKMDAAHLDLDIEWHKRAIQGEEQRAAEATAPLAIKVGTDTTYPIAGGLCAQSELSTATGTTTCVQTRQWTPQTTQPQHVGLTSIFASPMSAS